MDRKDMDNSTLRRFVDGELPPAEHEAAARAVAASPELQERCAAERALREAVARAMTTASSITPADLHDRVQQVLRETSRESAELNDPASRRNGRPEIDAASGAPPTAGRVKDEVEIKVDADASSGRVLLMPPGYAAASDTESDADAATEQVLAIPRRPLGVSAFAVAATLLIITGVVVLSIVLPPIDHWGSSHPTIPSGGQPEFVVQEHARCAGSEAARKNACEYRNLHEARIALAGALGLDPREPLPPIFDLSDIGYEFLGAGRSGVPGATSSCHLVYRKPVGGRFAYLSVFMAPNRELRCEQGIGEWVSRHCEIKGVCKGRVLSACDEQLHYWVTCCRAEDLAPIKDAVSRTLAARSIP